MTTALEDAPAPPEFEVEQPPAPPDHGAEAGEIDLAAAFFSGTAPKAEPLADEPAEKPPVQAPPAPEPPKKFRIASLALEVDPAGDLEGTLGKVDEEVRKHQSAKDRAEQRSRDLEAKLAAKEAAAPPVAPVQAAPDPWAGVPADVRELTEAHYDEAKAAKAEELRIMGVEDEELIETLSAKAAQGETNRHFRTLMAVHAKNAELDPVRHEIAAARMTAAEAAEVSRVAGRFPGVDQAAVRATLKAGREIYTERYGAGWDKNPDLREDFSLNVAALLTRKAPAPQASAPAGGSAPAPPAPRNPAADSVPGASVRAVQPTPTPARVAEVPEDNRELRIQRSFYGLG